MGSISHPSDGEFVDGCQVKHSGKNVEYNTGSYCYVASSTGVQWEW